jgi:protoporphyrinogen/coproporphyrinogen III oxidase
MIAIIGGGISGLTLAYYLQQQNKAYILLESSAVPGGYMQSETISDVVVEKGPNSILADDFVFNYLHELGLSKEIVKANSISKKRFVYKDGKYRALPSGPISLLFSSYFSFRNRLKILGEFFNKKGVAKDITLYELISARFGKEAADYALDPFVSGVYAGNAKELLADLCFPVLRKNIEQHGSILKGFIKNPPQRKTSITFKNGLGQLIETIANKVTHIRYNTEVTAMHKQGQTWKLNLSTVHGTEVLECSQVVLALPAYRAATLVKSFSEEWSTKFAAVEYPMVRNAHVVFPKSYLGFKAEGFGALHPSVEPLFTAGVIWNTAVFKGRTKGDHVLFTCMVTEKRIPELRNMSEEAVKQKLIAEIKTLYKLKGEAISVRMGVWEKAIPQYTTAMRSILDNSEELEKMNVYICSNWPKGISITDCIHGAYDLSKQLK